MTRDNLEKELDRIDGSPAVECMDNEAFYVLAHELNDKANALQIRVNDLKEANWVLTKMRNKIRRLSKVEGAMMSLCEAREWLLK